DRHRCRPPGHAARGGRGHPGRDPVSDDAPRGRELSESGDAGVAAPADPSPSGAPDHGESAGGVTVLEPDTRGDVVDESFTEQDLAVETAEGQRPASLIAEE